MRIMLVKALHYFEKNGERNVCRFGGLEHLLESKLSVGLVSLNSDDAA